MTAKELFEQLGFRLIDFNEKEIRYQLKNDYEDYSVIFNLKAKDYDVYFYIWMNDDFRNSAPMQERTGKLKHCALYGHWQIIHFAMPIELHNAINQQIKELGWLVEKWILPEERMPEEHDTFFAKYKGTERWNSAMFEKISDDVIATVEYENGNRKAIVMKTLDGNWKFPNKVMKQKVIAWQPLPKPYEENVGSR